MTFLSRETRVGRLRVRAAADDPLATGMRTEAALRPLDLVPPGMPPQAILCIRSMDDPLPGGIDVRSAHAPRPTEWERTARGAIGDALRRAIRVAAHSEAVAAAAEAPDAVVLFADRAELLAAAARDAVHDRLARWYWKDILRQPEVAAVIAEWKREPMYVPAALELLAAGGAKDDLVAFARRIPPPDALELTARVFPAITTTTPIATPEPPWIEVVPEAAEPALAPEQRLLIGVALTIRRAASLARRASFAAASAFWITTSHPPVIPSVARDLEGRAAREAPDTTFGTPPSRRLARRRPRRRGEGAPGRRPASRRGRRRSATQSQHSAAPVEPTTAPQRARREKHTQLLIEPSTPTDFAGLFFFLNLNLYDDDCELGPWQFLALLGRTLVPELPEDPLWAVLEELAEEPLDLELEPLDLTDLELLLSERLPVDDPISFLLRRFGRVTLTPAHVDVFFSLAAHPIEIRLSGLDRDPGWMLPAGRHVAFHFD
jgi:hypothetical protein